MSNVQEAAKKTKNTKTAKAKRPAARRTTSVAEDAKALANQFAKTREKNERIFQRALLNAVGGNAYEAAARANQIVWMAIGFLENEQANPAKVVGVLIMAHNLAAAAREQMGRERHVPAVAWS